jgi:uncharacterized protein YecT (DUF1311 family)
MSDAEIGFSSCRGRSAGRDIPWGARMKFMLFGMLLAIAALPGKAGAADDPAETACHQRETTVGIMDCLVALSGQWDKRLNAAYQAALKDSESDARKQALIRAERAWIAYRQANCGWYDAQQGTIREVEGADCIMHMTRDRAVELENR